MAQCSVDTKFRLSLSFRPHAQLTGSCLQNDAMLKHIYAVAPCVPQAAGWVLAGRMAECWEMTKLSTLIQC